MRLRPHADLASLSSRFVRRAGPRRLDLRDEALDALRREHFDLVLVNRVNDSDDAPGVDLIRSVKAEPGLAGVPMMLVSNFPEAQQEAEALGALPGFGKSDLASAATRQRLEAILELLQRARGPGGPGRDRR